MIIREYLEKRRLKRIYATGLSQIHAMIIPMKTRLAAPSRWLPPLTAASIFGVVLLRSLLVFQETDDLTLVLSTLGIWLVLLVSEAPISRKWPYHKFGGYFPIYLVIQTSLICMLLVILDRSDFLAILFAILSMQVMVRFRPKVGRLCVGLFAPLIALSLSASYSVSEANALALIYTGLNIFVAFYTRATQRALAARAQNQKMAEELEANNRQLQAYSQQLEQLAAARERLHLARELHDSVTQTIFSMNLSTQSALVLLERDPSRVAGQLDHLNQLAQSALSEMRVLITELRPEPVAEGGLAAALRQHIASRPLPESMAVSIEVEGDQPLRPAEEQVLFRIVQEAINNMVKHSGASQATIRLHQTEPFWIEVEDKGQGFDLHTVQTGSQSGSQVGLASMRERAEEIGWNLTVITSPGMGTRIRVEKPTGERKT
jgi:signal transduction histidine kinase